MDEGCLCVRYYGGDIELFQGFIGGFGFCFYRVIGCVGFMVGQFYIRFFYDKLGIRDGKQVNIVVGLSCYYFGGWKIGLNVIVVVEEEFWFMDY